MSLGQKCEEKNKRQRINIINQNHPQLGNYVFGLVQNEPEKKLEQKI
jgi:hypothetical protein